MSETAPKVEFALGSEVSPGHFFKSTFARSLITATCRDAKSLDYEFLDNGTIVEEPSDTNSPRLNGNVNNNNFYSLMNFETGQPNTSVWNSGKSGTTNGDLTMQQQQQQQPELNGELEKLRKQCQTLTEENERLQESLRNQQANVQVIDNVYLQNQIATLQWQLKQNESNRQMYRSLMEQVVRFLDRARKSLDIIHEKSSTKRSSCHSSSNVSIKEKSRVPRSRSVHTVHDDHIDSPSRMTTSSSCASSTTSSSSASSTSSSSSRFSRAKSVAQITNCNGNSSSGGLRDFTWSVLRRNDPVHCTPPRTKPPPPPVSPSPPAQDMNKSQDCAVYRRPKQSEIDPDDVPPEKLSQEAFRLMRTVQSLLIMREPDLTRLSTSQEINMSNNLNNPDLSSLSLQNNFANSTALQEGIITTGSSSSDRGTEGSGSCCADDEVNRTAFSSSSKSSTIITTNKTISPQTNTILMSPGARQSIDATSVNSASSKNTEDEESSTLRNSNFSLKQTESQQLPHNNYFHVTAPTSTPHNQRIKRTDRKEHLKSLRDWALGNSSSSVTNRPKPSTSVSSAEDESGFSSLSSFQEVGLPNVPNLTPVKGGCHTEVGLPEVPLEKIRHRRWSSTPSEFQALYKRHSGSFASTAQPTTESLSVWV